MQLTRYFTVRNRRPSAVEAPTTGYRAQVWLDVPLSVWQTEFKTHINYKIKQFETIHALLIFYKIPCEERGQAIPSVTSRSTGRHTSSKYSPSWVFEAIQILRLVRVRDLRKATISCPSVRPPAWNNSAPTEYIFMSSHTRVFFAKSVDKIQVSLNSYKNNSHFTLRPTYICDNISSNSS